MSAENTNQNHDDLLDELLPDSARDLLISRVIDGRASTSDWDRFRALASREPEIWCELAETQEQHEAVRCELAGAIAAADQIDLPVGPIDDTHTRERLGMVGKWGGWALAAALLLAWSLGYPMLPAQGGSGNGTQTAGLPVGGLGGIGLTEAEPEQAFEQYMSAGQKAGRVIAEMPEQVVVETRPMPDGSIEVMYLRQVIERRVIDQAYRQVRDDAGNTIAVPVRFEPRTNNAY
ncbi:MAG: hypothetical protein CMJ35_10615 [Phycisphaerae bacterium]|nr:hypothetical protein [Phycisphaerae bacterium]MBM92050.1 hypothetical protein [Phycisphaerae bacterium]HCT44077.1 hypothetical protein [Phycisphaerales bacterium]